MGHKEIVMILTLGVISLNKCAPEPHSMNNKWQRPGLIPQQIQDYNNILIGIDQRLRNLDSLRHVVSRTEISLQSLSNRMELIESRLQSVQNSFQHTFEAVTTAVKSSEMKYELLIEQLSRKLEAGMDRLSHRLTTIESRTEAAVNKVQSQIEIQFNRVDGRQNSIINDVSRINTNVDALRISAINSEERTNQTFLMLINHLKEIRLEQTVKKEHLKNITNLVIGLNSSRSEMFGLSDAPALPQEGLKMIRAIIIDEGNKIATKVHNMFNELWKTIRDIEGLIKKGFEETNNTNQDLYNKLTEMLMEEQTNSESFIDVVIQSVLTQIGDLLGDLQRKIDNRFMEIETNHKAHGETCDKLKGLIEDRIALILEKILETFINRTDKFAKQVTDLAELLKSQSKQLAQATVDTNNNIVTFAEENSQDHKQLDNAITDAAETCQDLQVQTQETNDLLLKNEATIKEIKSILLMSKEDKSLLNVTKMLENRKLHAVEANFSNGILNIKTDPSNKDSMQIENSQEEVQTGIPLEALNKTISTTNIDAVIGEPRRKDVDDENTTNKGLAKELAEEFDAQGEMDKEETKAVDLTHFLLAYIKVLHGHLTPQEFLEEAIPGNQYESFEDMIQHLRKAKVPRETIHDIEQLAQEQEIKESLQTDREIGQYNKRLHLNRDVENEDENYDDED